MRLGVVCLLFLGLAFVAEARMNLIPLTAAPKKISFKAVVDGGKKQSVQLKRKDKTYSVISNDKTLESRGLQRSTVVYDLNNPAERMVIISTGQGKNSKCFYMATPKNFIEMNSLLVANDGGEVTFSSTVEVDGRAKAKSKKDVKKWLKTWKTVKSVCRRSQIIEATSLAEKG